MKTIWKRMQYGLEELVRVGEMILTNMNNGN
jgi:hypothetical protein